MSIGPNTATMFTSTIGGIVLAVVGTVVIVNVKGVESLSHVWVPLVTLGFAVITLYGMVRIAKATNSENTRVLWNCVFMTIVVAGYFAIVQRNVVSLLWFVYAVALVIGIQVGALLFLRFRERTMKRLVRHYCDSDDPVPFKFEFEFVFQFHFKSSFKRHSIVYSSLPAGAVLSAYGTMLEFWSPDEVTLATIGCIFGVASLMLCIFLILDMRELLTPGLKRALVTRVNLNYDGLVLLPLSDGRDLSDEEKRGVLDATVAATEVRKLFLYNQYQMLAVLVASVYVVLSTMGIQAFDLWVGATLAVFAVMVSQFPFVLGQRFAHACALEPYSGIEREELRQKLEQFAGLFPTGKMWIALTGSGTIGAIANTLITKLIGAT